MRRIRVSVLRFFAAILSPKILPICLIADTCADWGVSNRLIVFEQRIQFVFERKPHGIEL
jgi:hypothetical protein